MRWVAVGWYLGTALVIGYAVMWTAAIGLLRYLGGKFDVGQTIYRLALALAMFWLIAFDYAACRASFEDYAAMLRAAEIGLAPVPIVLLVGWLRAWHFNAKRLQQAEAASPGLSAVREAANG